MVVESKKVFQSRMIPVSMDITADDYITLELPDVGYTYRVDVLNMDGKLLMTKSFPKNGRHDIHWNVAPGVYLIRILRSDGSIEQKRVVKR
ncbi:MAG TPA: hypothetical protein DDX92_06870 [Flavobacteriales bacterium]|jgi:hypothetical protein|nr:hypothetical protein [Flavobacteriales bacterium]